MNIHYLRRQLKKRQMHKNYEIKPIGSALKLRRQQLGMTLEEGAEGICSISYLSKLENNQIEPNPEFVELLSERFGMKQQKTYDRDDYEKDLRLITDWMIEQHIFDETLLVKYQGHEDHQSLLIHLIHDSMNHQYHLAEKRYHLIKQFIPNMTQDELSLFIFCLANLYFHHHQYREARTFILELPRAHDKNFDHYILSLRIRLLTSLKLHDGAEITAFYHEYLNLISKEGHFHLMQEIKNEYYTYLAWYQPIHTLLHLSKRNLKRKTSMDYPNALTYYRHQHYHQVIHLSKQQPTHDGWYIILLLTYEKLGDVDQLSSIIQAMESIELNPSEAILYEYMKYKHFTTKEMMLNYLRREILNANLQTDDYLVNDYIIMDTQHLFAKSQFYKEANQVMVNYYRRANQPLSVDINIEDED